jgi:DNA polymerase-3 subunit beta
MKIEILQENLIKGLSAVSKVVSGKPPLAILGNLLLETVDGQLKLTGTNLEISLEFLVGAKVEQEGRFTVPARTLTEIIGSLPPGKITLEQKEGQLLVTMGKFTAKINGIPAAEWPQTETTKDEAAICRVKIDFSKFKELVFPTIIAVGTDDARPALTGILFKGGKNLTLVATDGFRLSQVVSDLKTEDFSVIIPAKAVAEITRLEGKNLEMIIFPTRAVFNLEEVVLTTQLITGNFPPYEKIIPQSWENSGEIDAPELLKAVKLAGIFARDSANVIKFKISASPASGQNSKFKIFAQAQQTGENENEIEIKTEKPQDEEFTIAFNYHYLLDLLTTVGDRPLRFAYTNSLTAGLFTIPKNNSFLHLIMPVRIQS